MISGYAVITEQVEKCQYSSLDSVNVVFVEYDMVSERYEGWDWGAPKVNDNILVWIDFCDVQNMRQRLQANKAFSADGWVRSIFAQT